MKDFRGQDIKVGDTVVWPSRHSSSQWMNEGTVLAVHEAEGGKSDRLVVQPILRHNELRHRYHDSYRSAKKTTLFVISGVTVVPSLPTVADRVVQAQAQSGAVL